MIYNSLDNKKDKKKEEKLLPLTQAFSFRGLTHVVKGANMMLVNPADKLGACPIKPPYGIKSVNTYDFELMDRIRRAASKKKHLGDFEVFYKIKQAKLKAMSFTCTSEETKIIDQITGFCLDKASTKVEQKVTQIVYQIASQVKIKIMNDAERLLAEFYNSQQSDKEREREAQEKLKESIINKSKVTMPVSSPSKIQKETRVPQPSVRSIYDTRPVKIGKSFLEFNSDPVYGNPKKFYIGFRQTKDKWTHFMNYESVKRPNCLPSHITDLELLSQPNKISLRKQITVEEVNSLQSAIKSFCLDKETEILHNATFDKVTTT